MMDTFSHSRLTCFSQCPLKFKFAYIDKLETERKGTVEAFMGSMVHAALEKLYKDMKFEKLCELRELIDFYKREWEKNWTESIHFVREDYTEENYRKMGEKYITDYYNRHYPFDQAKTIGLETQDYVYIDDEKKYRMHVRIDRLATAKDGTYEIHDYKTSGTLPTQEKIDTDAQLAIYAYGIKKLYPDADKIKLIWHYLAFDRELVSERTDEELEELRRDIIRQIKAIEEATEFPANRSALCDWCEFQAECPQFRHLLKTKDMPVNEFLNDDGVSLVNRYAEAKKRADELAEKIENIKEALRIYAEKNNMTMIYGSDMKATVRQYPRLSFPKKDEPAREGFFRAIKQIGLWDELSTVDTYDLAKMINSREIPDEIVKLLEPFMTRGTTTWIGLSRK